MPKELPSPLGLVGNICDLIAQYSVFDKPNLAIMGAISIGSVLIANRYKLGETWPNIYTMGVAPTGSGKNFPYNVAMRLLAVDYDTGLFGKETVLSGQALLKGLESQRERLDIIDECSQLFHTILKGGVFQTDILTILLKLYSQSSALFIGPESKGSDPVRVFHPCVSSMMLTNREDLIMSTTKNFISGGFFPRFLTFVEWDYGREKINPRWNEALAAEVVEGIKAIMNVPIEMDERPGKKNILAPKPMPRETQISDSARTILKEYSSECRREIASDNTEDIRRYFLTRAPQNAEKLALIHGVLLHGRISDNDVLWAISMVDTCMYNSMPIYAQICARTPTEAAVIGILEIVRKYGFVTVGKLYEETRQLSRMLRNDAIDALQIEGKIREITTALGRGYEALI